MFASYLAKVRGSGEPESSKARVKDLERFIREVEAFLTDYGDVNTNRLDGKIQSLRLEFEEILGLATESSSSDRGENKGQTQQKSKEEDLSSMV